MKIVSIVVFAVALIGSWCLTRGNSAVPQSMHLDIQNNLKDIISEYVEKSLPESKNLQFERLWTESVKGNRIKAVFAYSFADPTQENGEATVEIQGTAILNRVEETADTVTWSLDELQIENSKVEFQEPIHITAGADEFNPSVEDENTENQEMQ